MRGALVLAVALAALAGPAVARAQVADSSASGADRPFVSGGYDDKPYLSGLFGRVRLGGYLEGAGIWEREDGATSEFGFELTRLSVMTSTDLRGRVQVWAEIEFEEGGEEIEVELAQVDLLMARALNLRGGILLLPLGRFNLAHDGPRTELPARPLLATDLIGSALSQPGLGVFGRFEGSPGRLTYEAYAVTGYDDGILEDSPDGTRLPLGAANPEDENNSPAWVGRAEWGPRPWASIGLSGYHGAYNVYRVEGLEVDARRNLSVAVVDGEASGWGFVLSAEGAIVEVEIPETLAGVFASRQGGFFVQASRPFGAAWFDGLPGSRFTAALRVDVVDFDRDLAGDSMRSLTLGLNFRPIAESAFKLAYTRGESRDRFNNLGTDATWALGLATYF